MLTEREMEGIYGSRMMSGAELGDQKLRLTIKDVRRETLQGRAPGEPARAKIVLEFNNSEKALALNATNFNYLRNKLGRDPRAWVGKEIGIHAEDTSFGGRPVRGLRVKVLNGKGPDFNDDISDTF